MSISREKIRFVPRSSARWGTTTDTIGNTTLHSSVYSGYVHASRVTASKSGALASLGINIEVAAGNGRLALYADNGSGTYPSGAPLKETASQALANAWNDLTATGVTIVLGTYYWIAAQVSSDSAHLYSDHVTSARKYMAQAYGAFPTWSGTLATSDALNMRMKYSGFS